jgi:hypothetical protein
VPHNISGPIGDSFQSSSRIQAEINNLTIAIKAWHEIPQVLLEELDAPNRH